MQISKILTKKTALVAAIGLACASVVTFSAPAQAGYGCSTCKVVKYKVHYRTYGCGYRCGYRCYTPCNTCNYCNYGCGSGGCGYYGYYGGYYY